MANNTRFFKKLWSIFLYMLLGIFTIFLLLFIFIYTPPGKRAVRNRVQSFLQEKLQTKVTIGAVDYSLPQWLEIKRIYIEDQHKDTLLYGEELSADLNMFKLLRGNTDIQKLFFKNILINVHRDKDDSVFNYQFVVDAFTGNKATTALPDTAALKMSLDRLIFDNVAFRSKDEYGGQDFVARIKSLDATLNKFQPDRINFGINDFAASGIDFFMSSYAESVKDSLIKAAPDTIKPASAYGLYITAGHFNVRDVNITIEDKVDGMYYANRVTKLGLSNALLNVRQSIILADSISLDSSFVQFTQPVVKPIRIVDTTLVPWLIQAKQLNVSSTQLQYDDVNEPKAGGFDLAHFDASRIKANISSFLYSEDSTAAFINQLAFNDASGFVLDTMHANFLFTEKTLSAKELYVKTPESIIQDLFEIRYDSITAMKLQPQNSLVNATLNNSVIAFNDLYLLFPFLKQSFPPTSFANNKVRLNTELRGNLQRLYLPYFQLSGLTGSSLTGRGTLFNLADPQRFSYDLYIEKGIINKRDLLKFIPATNAEAVAQLPGIFNISGHVVGDRNNVIADINTSSAGFAFNGRVRLNNFSTPADMKYDLLVKNASLDRNFIIGFFPADFIPPEINLPKRIVASGMFRGSANDFIADLKLNGSYGQATVKGYMRNMKNPESAIYDLYITANRFQAGQLLRQDSLLGTVTGAFTAKGTGFNYKTMRSVISADIAALQYNKYNYQNALINSRFNKGNITSEGKINDPHLVLDYTFNGNMQGQYPAFDVVARIDTAQLKELNLYSDTLNFSLDANIKANNTQPRNLDINSVVTNSNVQMDKGIYFLDTMSLIASSANGVDDISFRSPFAQLHANGAFDYDKVGTSILQYINHYYQLAPDPKQPVVADQQLVFDGILKKDPLVTGLVPGLNDYKDIQFSGSFVSANTDSALNFNAVIPYLDYGAYKISEGNVTVASRNERINYDIKLDTMRYAGNTFYGTILNGSAANDSLALNAVTQDNKRTDWFGANAALYTDGETISFRLKDNLLLNYERWAVAPENAISYSPQGIMINNFSISSDTSRININSRQQVPNSPIDVTIDNFNLKSISSFLSGDTLLATGVMDVKALVSELDKNIPAFTGNASVTDLHIMNYPVGNITAFAEKQSENTIAANMQVVGYGNDINARGNYYLNNIQQEFDADLDIKKLNLATVQGFTQGSIQNASGNLYGQLNLQGKFSEPRWNGLINFDTTRFTIAQFGTPYKVNSQQIRFAYPRIEFNKFIVKDSLDHEMTIDGALTANSLYKYDLDLDLDATDFIIMNAKKTIGNELYGYASVDADMTIRGTSETPEIEGDVYVNDNSNVTIVLPETSYNKDDSKTVVRFIDRDTFAINPPATAFEPEEEEQVNFARFINYNLNIEVNKNSSLTIIVDPVTGDELTVQGDAQLNAGVDPGGNIILAGNYELDKGTYVLNYQFLQRKFNLLKGSTISFGGAPMDARINITAEYIANTSAKDLLGNEVSDVSPGLANSFNQKVPFKVLLYLTGVLSRPDINFDIQLPEESSLVSTELRTTIENKLIQLRGDVAAINKQVFSLLLLNRFVGEESSDFFKGNGSDFTELARQSVSQFLSSALNEIASDLFKGIDVDLNLNTYRDFNGGSDQTRTDLNVALSKSFLDDRLIVSVGKNFGIEGDDPVAKVSGNSSRFMPDLTLTYKLTKDGKYMIRGYRRNQFEVVLDGYVVETGLSFLVTIDYNKFRELFRRKK